MASPRRDCELSQLPIDQGPWPALRSIPMGVHFSILGILLTLHQKNWGLSVLQSPEVRAWRRKGLLKDVLLSLPVEQ